MADRQRLVIPSGGAGQPRRRARLIAILAVRDEMRFLPGWFRNVPPHVDGVVTLDDGSSDGSGDFLAARPEVRELIRIPPHRPAWDEPGNHRRLCEAALRHGAGWILQMDADERVERSFRARAERVIQRGRLLGADAFEVRLRDIWGSHDRYRADGVWDRRRYVRLWAATLGADVDARPLHAEKVPRGARRARADLHLYHLRMVDPHDRVARRRRYEALDPQARLQPGIGYAYLTDETGIELRPIPPRRGFID